MACGGTTKRYPSVATLMAASRSAPLAAATGCAYGADEAAPESVEPPPAVVKTVALEKAELSQVVSGIAVDGAAGQGSSDAGDDEGGAGTAQR